MPEKTNVDRLKELLNGTGVLPDHLDHLGPQETIAWAKAMRIRADAAKCRAVAIKERALAIRQLIEVAKLFFRLAPEEREWAEEQLRLLDGDFGEDYEEDEDVD